MATVTTRAADEPLTGWRYWQPSPGQPPLCSVALRRFTWPPGRPMEAVCTTGGHRPPAPPCGCGIYAAVDLGTLRRNAPCLRPGGVVVGEVDLWGDVVIDEDAYRGEYAYPRSLRVVEGTAPREQLEAALTTLGAYGVPTGVMDLHDGVGEIAAAILRNQAMSSGQQLP